MSDQYLTSSLTLCLLRCSSTSSHWKRTTARTTSVPSTSLSSRHCSRTMMTQCCCSYVAVRTAVVNRPYSFISGSRTVVITNGLQAVSDLLSMKWLSSAFLMFWYIVQAHSSENNQTLLMYYVCPLATAKQVAHAIFPVASQAPLGW